MTTKNSPTATKPTALPRGDIRYLVAAATLVVAVIGLAMIFGIVRAPALDDLTQDRAPSLSIAWTEYNERSDCTDLMVARPTGVVESIVCSSSLDRVIGWPEDGLVTIAYGRDGDHLEVRDPVTGEALSSQGLNTYVEKPKDDGGFAATRVDGLLVVADQWGTPIWEVEADARYEIGSIEVSPDGLWIAMSDSAERLLVLPSDGSSDPVIWATGVGGVFMVSPVWEDTEPPTS
ncbi:MAG: hypothetical protein JW722_08605 [Demequinaceae bacterium]|nr:hypothetical protein [Demequinaceae bacterium]